MDISPATTKSTEGRAGRAREAGIVVGGIAVLTGITAGYALLHPGRTDGGTGGAGVRTSAGRPVTIEPVDADAVTDGLLLPDGPKGTIKLTVHNPGSVPVRVTGVARTDRPVTANGGRGACAADVVTLDPVTLTGDEVVVPGQRRTLTLGGAAFMSAAAADGCQGATFVIPVRVTVVNA